MHRGASRGHREGAWILVLGILASACGGPDAPSPTTDSAVASALELRPVQDVVPRTSPDWESTEPTCPDEDAARCLAAARAEPVVVLAADEAKYVLGPAVIDGGDVVEAAAHEGTPASMGWSVDVQLSPEGSVTLASSTRAALDSLPPKDRIAIVVDGLVVSAPTVAAPITSGALVVAAGLSRAEAERLAASLDARG